MLATRGHGGCDIHPRGMGDVLGNVLVSWRGWCENEEVTIYVWSSADQPTRT